MKDKSGGRDTELHTNKGFDRNGSKKTEKLVDKVLDMDKKYGPNRSKSQDKKIKKAVSDYDKSSKKDMKKAVKSGDYDAAKSISAGRTYMKTLTDSGYLNEIIADASVCANVPAGKNFTYNVLRNDKLGGVTVTVNGHKETYIYGNPNDFKKMNVNNVDKMLLDPHSSGGVMDKSINSKLSLLDYMKLPPNANPKDYEKIDTIGGAKYHKKKKYPANPTF